MKIKTLLFTLMMAMLLASCSMQKRLAYDFVEQSKGASVAFYVPNELKISNIRKDCDPNSIELLPLDEEQLRDTIEARTKIVNKIDEKMFLDVMIVSFEETLKDYGLKLEYWENEDTQADSLHWVVDLSHVEIQELIEYLATYCGVEGNIDFFPSTSVGVASWFELVNDRTSEQVFTEQFYCEYIKDCYYSLDSLNNKIANVEYQNLTIDGFYDFAVMLGKLYAGYAYDYFMNDYIRQEMTKKGKEYDEEYYLRYDPYEIYIYNTWRDRMIKIEE